MTSLFKKLNYTGQNPILVYNAPAEFEPALAEVAAETNVDRTPRGTSAYGFIMVFGITGEAIRTGVGLTRPKLRDGGVYWICYPKGSSPRLKSDINRDKLWPLAAPFGLQPVRQVAIDEDWSALRFKADRTDTT